jgi:hypothetical protein
MQLLRIVLLALIVVLPPALVLILIGVARERRQLCRWSAMQARLWLWLGIIMIAVAVVVRALNPAITTRLIAISCWGLVWAGTYLIAKSVYRKRDIKSTQDALASAHLTKP